MVPWCLLVNLEDSTVLNLKSEGKNKNISAAFTENPGLSPLPSINFFSWSGPYLSGRAELFICFTKRGQEHQPESQPCSSDRSVPVTQRAGPLSAAITPPGLSDQVWLMGMGRKARLCRSESWWDSSNGSTGSRLGSPDHTALYKVTHETFSTSKLLIPAGAHYTELDTESKCGRQPSKMALQTLASWHSCPCIILPFECGLDLVTCS